MRPLETRGAGVFFCLCLISFFVVTAALADVPRQISYQGRLTDAAGQPVADGSYVMDFAIYATQTGGSPVWQESGRVVSVSGGLFTTLLGKEVPLPDSGLPVTAWLETRVGGIALSPRVRLASVPFALRSLTAEHVLPDAAVTSLNSLKGDVTLAAGDNISITQSGNTITLAGLNIPNPLPVSQSGAWNVGITGTPSVNVANSPAVRIDTSQNTVRIDTSQNTVKTTTQSGYIQLWTSNMTVNPGASIWSPSINCDGYKELRFTLFTTSNYTQPELIRIRIRYLTPNNSWALIGTADFATPSIQPIAGANFQQSSFAAILIVPALAPQMRLEIVNNRTTAVEINSSSCVYLVN
ncbi:MAG: hypothetical protein KatS3mg024_1769 [Armatimonadota bacterium]|nr:MAG: hypothetical protein KatS3mg024_1769 [Armatimonadota bacterium]